MKKIIYDRKTEAPDDRIKNFATLYTIEFMSEKDVMKTLGVGMYTMRKWYEMGLGLCKIDDKKFIKKSELNAFLQRFITRAEVERIKTML